MHGRFVQRFFQQAEINVHLTYTLGQTVEPCRKCCGALQEADELAGRQRQLADAKQRLANERKALELAQEALEASLAEVRRPQEPLKDRYIPPNTSMLGVVTVLQLLNEFHSQFWHGLAS